jgi:hypothetical protein
MDSVADRPLAQRLADLVRSQLLEVRVAATRTRLDERIAAGVRPDSRVELALRADQLVRPRYRRRLASYVEGLVAEFDADRGWWLAAPVPYLRPQVAEARSTLLSLAQVLRHAERVRPRGVAIVSRLLWDPASSPLYVRTARGALQLHAQTALDHLLGQRQARWESGAAAPPATQGGSDGGP